MKTLTNKTNAPIRVPLPRGKSLHLGPRNEGQIRDEDADHPALKKLVDAGKLAIYDGGQRSAGSAGSGAAPHEATHGHARGVNHERSGDR